MSSYIMKDILVFVKLILSNATVTINYPQEDLELRPYPLSITASNDGVTVTLTNSIVVQLGGIEHIKDNAQEFYNGLTGNGRQDTTINALIHSVAMELSTR